MQRLDRIHRNDWRKKFLVKPLRFFRQICNDRRLNEKSRTILQNTSAANKRPVLFSHFYTALELLDRCFVDERTQERVALRRITDLDRLCLGNEGVRERLRN